MVAAIEYDPNRSARIALLHYVDGEKRYIICPVGLEVGRKVTSGPEAEIFVGNALPLKNIPGRYGGAQHRIASGQGWPDGALGRCAGAVGFKGRRHCAVEACLRAKFGA